MIATTSNRYSVLVLTGPPSVVYTNSVDSLRKPVGLSREAVDVVVFVTILVSVFDAVLL